MGYSILLQHILGLEWLFTMQSRPGGHREAPKCEGTKARTHPDPEQQGLGLCIFGSDVMKKFCILGDGTDVGQTN